MTERKRRRRSSPKKRSPDRAAAKAPSATRDRSAEHRRKRAESRPRKRPARGYSTLRPSSRTPLWVGTLLGVAFACGIVFGKQDSKKTAAAATQVEQTVGAILDEADRSAERYRDVKEKLRLTFHEELKKAPALLPVAATQPAPAPKKPPPAPAHEPPATPAAKKAPPAPVVVAQKPAPKSDPDMAKLREAIAARVKVAAAPAKPAAKKPAPAATTAAGPERPHFVQVASFPEASAAQRLVERLKSAGVTARVSSFDLGGGRTAHRVVTGTVPSKEAADALAQRVKTATGLSGLVRRAK